MSRIPANDLPQPSSLLKVHVINGGGIGADFAHPLLVLGDGALNGTRLSRTVGLGAGARGKMRRPQRGANVVGIVAIVAGEVHEAVALEGTVDGLFGCVGRQHLVVCTNAVASGIWVGEHASLEHYSILLVFLLACRVLKEYSLGSADGAHPGTMLDGENAACSISVK